MPPLQIPRRYRAGLDSVDTLTDAEVGVLVQRLDASASEVSFKDLAAQVRDEISAEVDVTEMVEALASLITLLPEDGSGAEILAQDVSESEDLHIPADRRAAYASRLRALITTPALTIVARASEVVTEHDKVFHDARIFTDLRPVFERDPTRGVKLAGLVGTMKLDYHPGGRRTIDSVFVTLDRGDLEHFRRVVERALAKMDALSQLLKESDVRRWTENYHEHGPT